MPKPEATPLAAAAAAFDAELAVYARLGDVFLRTPLTTLKHLERANHTLRELGDCELRLQDAGKQLIAALSGSRQRQEQLSEQVMAHVPLVQARNARLAELMAAMTELGAEVAAINALISPAGTGADHVPPDPGEISTAALALADRAESLATAAREAELEELGTQAHALYQRLKAIGTKLQKAAPN